MGTTGTPASTTDDDDEPAAPRTMSPLLKSAPKTAIHSNYPAATKRSQIGLGSESDCSPLSFRTFAGIVFWTDPDNMDNGDDCDDDVVAPCTTV